MKKNSTDKLTLILIDSKKYLLKKTVGKVIAFMGIILAGMVFARGTNGNFLSRIIELPLWVELMLGVCTFVLIVLGTAFQFNKEKDKGEIQFSTQSLNLYGNEINLANTPMTISLNASQEKGIYERTIKDNGGNNWIELALNGVPKKFEFLISSQKKEDELTELIDEYWKKGFKVELKASPPSFWEKMSF